MSRCHLNEHAFYELIPVVMRTEHVVLEGNRFFPLEMKIFARQVKDCTALRLDTIVLTGCQVSIYFQGIQIQHHPTLTNSVILIYFENVCYYCSWTTTAWRRRPSG